MRSNDGAKKYPFSSGVEDPSGARVHEDMGKNIGRATILI